MPPDQAGVAEAAVVELTVLEVVVLATSIVLASIGGSGGVVPASGMSTTGAHMGVADAEAGATWECARRHQCW